MNLPDCGIAGSGGKIMNSFRQIIRKIIFACFFVVISGLVLAAQKVVLPEHYKKWLDEDVVYIITRAEREVFLQLRSDRERELFIEAFWRQRDPNPTTPENEFKTEHYRRIKYANRYFGRDAARLGWKTDRGRVYIILGEPQDIHRYEGRSNIYDCEVWFYQGKTDLGLPPGFYVLFFREYGRGEYKIYSPLNDGPQKLMIGYQGDPVDLESAFMALQKIEPSLANISISLIPGEESLSYGRPSMTSDLLIRRIESLPSRMVEDKYARKFLQYKDLVEVEYSANYIDSDSLVRVFRDPSGLHFVHYSIEPLRLSVNQYNDRFSTILLVNGRVTTPEGHLVYQFDRKVALELNDEQMKSASRAPFNFHDLFPLLPGEYNISVLMKNEASKEFTSIEAKVNIPAVTDRVLISNPVLGYKVLSLARDERRTKAFRLGPYQIYCQPNRIFTSSDNMAVVFQVDNLTQEIIQKGELRISVHRDDQLVKQTNRNLSECKDLPVVVEEILMKEFPPAHYKVLIALVYNGEQIAAAEELFDLTYAQAIPRPWVSARVLPDLNDPIYGQIIGMQLANLGRLAEARLILERTYQRRPDLEDLTIGLARVYIGLEEFGLARQVLMPEARNEQKAKYEVFTLLAEACRGLGDFSAAIGFLDKAIVHYGINATLLNAIGENYLSLGKNSEALSAFEKSLQLSPEQPAIKAKVEQLKKKK